MRTISAQSITDTVARLCIEANTRLPQDVEAALARAPGGRAVAAGKEPPSTCCGRTSVRRRSKALPICQDTGMACVFVELGQDVHIDGDFEAAVHEGVRRGYADGYLRKSIVARPPAPGQHRRQHPCRHHTAASCPATGCTITVAPKGFGSENMSRLADAQTRRRRGRRARTSCWKRCRLAGSNPCPPIVLGVGVGGSFDKVAYLAKKALLPPAGQPQPGPLLCRPGTANCWPRSTRPGIGPQGFGGRTTCLGLAIEADAHPCGGSARGRER